MFHKSLHPAGAMSGRDMLGARFDWGARTGCACHNAQHALGMRSTRLFQLSAALEGLSCDRLFFAKRLQPLDATHAEVAAPTLDVPSMSHRVDDYCN